MVRWKFFSVKLKNWQIDTHHYFEKYDRNTRNKPIDILRFQGSFVSQKPLMFNLCVDKSSL